MTPAEVPPPTTTRPDPFIPRPEPSLAAVIALALSVVLFVPLIALVVVLA